MNKFLKCLTLSAVSAFLCVAVLVSGCSSSEAVGISSIEKTAVNGNVDTYTIYYTDGSTSTYNVTNGNDGEDSAVTVDELYQTYKSYYGEDLTYSEFLEKYLSNVSTDTTDTASNTNSIFAINNCLLSSASVYCEYEYTYTYSTGFMGGGPFGSSTTTGTAVTYASGTAILYEKGEEYTYFVTNYHVVYEYSYGGISDTIHIYLYGSEDTPTASYDTSGYITSLDYGNYAIECEYVGGSAASDIAVLRANTADVDAINPDFKAVTIADGYSVGETVFTIGNAESKGLSVTEGIVSVDSEYISLAVEGNGVYRSYRSLRMDTAMYDGNSGGGLFNENGELIGLVNAGNSSDQNINYAIPISIVTGTVDNIIYYYEDGDDNTTNAYEIDIGTTYTTENSKYVYDSKSGHGEITEDIIISTISDNSIAEQMGLSVGDILTNLIITDANGNTTTYQLTRSFNVSELLLTAREGYKISFTYTRDNSTNTTSVYTISSDDLAQRT